MYKEIFEVIKEYVLVSEGQDITVKGRIVKTRNKDEYRWEISHYWRGTEGASFYHPSKITSKSIEEVENLLFSYMKGFPGAEIEENNFYWSI